VQGFYCRDNNHIALLVCVHLFVGPCCFEAAAKGRPCECRQRQPGRKNRYNLNSMESWNCGKPTEPAFLGDHVHCYHPRLPRPGLYPKITFGQTDRTGRPLSGQAIELSFTFHSATSNGARNFEICTLGRAFQQTNAMMCSYGGVD
jgi:hypothetical protein